MSEPVHDEVLDGVPVLPGEPPAVSMSTVPASRALARAFPAPVRAATAAAGGFVAGAALLGLVHRRHSRRVALAGSRPSRRIGRRGRSKPVGQAIEIVGSRSLLVDVHLLGSPSRSR